jgi:hypothetical protein
LVQCKNHLPSKVSIEQTSSEKTALYKSTIVSGSTLIDLTGASVDDYYFQKVKSITHCEINTGLSEIVAHNFRQLGVVNIDCKVGDSLNTLESINQKWDWIYIDPSRRNDAKEKFYA